MSMWVAYFVDSGQTTDGQTAVHTWFNEGIPTTAAVKRSRDLAESSERTRCMQIAVYKLNKDRYIDVFCCTL